MIAASDPQEFIPSGRQQALRHPGPIDVPFSASGAVDDFLPNQFEKVSIKDSVQNEWWVIRKSPTTISTAVPTLSIEDKEGYAQSYTHLDVDHSHHADFSFESPCGEPSMLQKSMKRFFEPNVSKATSKRFSTDSDFKNDTKSSCNTNKSFAVGQPLKNKDRRIRGKLEWNFMEEELYVNGNVVIWSKGLVSNSDSLNCAKTTVCTYSSQFPITHALWCTFYDERPNFNKGFCNIDNTADKPKGKAIPAVCVVDSQNMKVFTADSENFINSLPFKVSKVWNVKYGILLEKATDENLSDDLPKLFSMSHPLEEVHPVAVRESTLNLIENTNLQIVHTEEEPSLALVYNSQMGHHSVYLIRKLRNDEWVDTSEKYTASYVSDPNKLKKRLPMSMLDLSKNNPRVTMSEANSRAASLASLCSIQPSRSHSSMAAISRCQSPAVSPLISSSTWYTHANKMQNSTRHTQTASSIRPGTAMGYSTDFSQQLEPLLCLDHVWTDYVSSTHDGGFVGPASKVFLCDDLTGQWYLCYLLPSKSQLSVVRIDFTNSNNLIFGIFTSISAKDAVAIPHLRMMAILEHTGNIVLFSGLTSVGKLHIGGILAQHTPSPFVKRSTPQFHSPFPRRSSLLPHISGTPLSEPRFDEHLFSPVYPCNYKKSSAKSGEGTSLIGLRDAVENRLSFHYSDGSYYRITLPSLVSAPIIEDCINALRQTLQRDVAILLFTRWYATRNAPGPMDVTVETEWKMFTKLLLELLGCDDNHGSESTVDSINTPSAPPKRQKPSPSGSEFDWKQMLSSNFNTTVCKDLRNTLNLKANLAITSEHHEHDNDLIKFNVNSILFPYIKIIHYTLHLLYEELKLNTVRSKDLPFLAQFLGQLSNDLGLKNYAVHYWKDFPELCKIDNKMIAQGDLKNVIHWAVMTEEPQCVMRHLYDMLRGVDVPPFPFIQNVNPRTKDIVQLYGVLVKGSKSQTKISLDSLIKTMLPTSLKCEPFSTPKAKTIVIDKSVHERAVLLMTEMNITNRVLDTLPHGINLLLYDALWTCRENPPSNWSAQAYSLLWRADLAAQSQIIKKEKVDRSVKKYGIYSTAPIQELLPTIKPGEPEQEDGMEDVESPLLKVRFSEDLRVLEARRLLQSSKPVPIVLVQRPDVSDHEFIEEQEVHLFALCTRTMALPVGRGMFTLRTATPVITEPLPVPQLCLTGKAPPRGTTIELTHIDTPVDMKVWPLFHNGVANGLRISPDAHNIDTDWILFNKPKTTNESQREHAGFLMALGLNGHLKKLAVLNRYNYLTERDDMTSLGILIGLSAAFRGTCHPELTRALSIHQEALLPPTSMEIDVSQNLQVAALLGVGLVYQGSAQRQMTEVLLSEIGRPPGPEMENCVDRESYSLTAGLALGLVTLQHGGRSSGLSDLNVPDVLHYYMVGGNKRPLTGSQKDKYKVPSFHIREGCSVNLDVTAPGATLALGLMYLGTGNKAIADWMAPPETQFLLDFVRPDFLMLRILSRALIMWNEIKPTEEWIEKQVPDTIRPFCMVIPSSILNVDYEAMNQAYCNIVAGACFSIGLKYAGSANESAFQALLSYCHRFTSLTGKSIADLAGKPTIETCLNVCLISAAMVMAGTGNLEIMRLVRHLRRRIGSGSSAVVTYGSHLMIHMALGLLFLGGGRYTLSNTPASVAALICAFYPKFPNHSNDNRYHLQAFRHLYVLAVEPRLIIPKDVGLGRMCYAHIKVTHLDGSSTFVKGPGIIPDLNTISKVEINDERYWPVVFERGRNWEQLQHLLSTSGYVEVKQRAGCLSYMEDKLGYHSQLARTLTQSETIPWDPPSMAIVSFTSECTLRHFCDNYLTPGVHSSSNTEARLQQMLTRVTYDCVIKEKLVVIPIVTTLIKIVKDISISPSALQLWQFKLVCMQVLNHSLKANLVSPEVVLALKQELVYILDTWENHLCDMLKSYLSGRNLNQSLLSDLRKVAAYVIYYDIPFDCTFNNKDHILEVIYELQSRHCSPESINKILQICT